MNKYKIHRLKCKHHCAKESSKVMSTQAGSICTPLMACIHEHQNDYTTSSINIGIVLIPQAILVPDSPQTACSIGFRGFPQTACFIWFKESTGVKGHSHTLWGGCAVCHGMGGVGTWERVCLGKAGRAENLQGTCLGPLVGLWWAGHLQISLSEHVWWIDARGHYNWWIPS